MNKISKVLTGLVVGAALFVSSIAPAQSPSLNYVSRTAIHVTTAATATLVSSDAYIVSVVISTSAVGTAFKAQIQNKEGTPKILVPAIGTAAVGTQAYTFAGQGSAVYMKGGIDVVSTGTPGVIDVFVTYYKP